MVMVMVTATTRILNNPATFAHEVVETCSVGLVERSLIILS